MFNLFKKKTQKEKELKKLEVQLFKLKKKRDFFIPRVKQNFLSSKHNIETISAEQERKILEYDEEISQLMQKVTELKSDMFIEEMKKLE